MERYAHISSAQFLLYYGFLTICLLWLALKYKKNKVALVIILLFSSGIVAPLGKSAVNIYKIITLIATLSLLLNQSVFVKLTNRLNIYILIFVAYIIAFIYSSLGVNNDGVLLTFAQINRFVIPFVLFFVMRKVAMKKPAFLPELNRLFFQLLIAQIIFSLAKLIVFGIMEDIVGSLSLQGGAMGTSVPLLGLLWFGTNTNMGKMEWKYWFFLVGLLFIGFMSGKRAIWFTFPILFLAYGLIVAKRKYPKQYISLLFLTPLFLYFGLRLSPTLNPENKIWGSFDPEYAYNYASDYSLGRQQKTRNFSPEDGKRKEGSGRVGANMVLWNILVNSKYDEHILFGNGASRVYAADAKNYRNADFYFGVDSKGSLTGVFQLWIAVGLVGIVLFLTYYLLLFREVKYLRLSLLFLAVAIYDFVFYAGTMAREPALSVFFAFLILYANMQYSKKGNFCPQEPFNFIFIPKKLLKRVQ